MVFYDVEFVKRYYWRETPHMARKQGRPKTGEAPLTHERILTVALHLVDTSGVDALSMRRLATELGVDPMAIYHHLPGKQAILAGLVQRVFDELRLPEPAPRGWQDRLKAFAHAYHNLARTHPHLIRYLVTDLSPTTPAVLAANEFLYAALADAGLSARMIVRAADLVVDYLNGLALAEQPEAMGHTDERADLLQQLVQRPSEHFPTLRRVLRQRSEEERVADVAAGLDIILAGLMAMSGDNEERMKKPVGSSC